MAENRKKLTFLESVVIFTTVENQDLLYAYRTLFTKELDNIFNVKPIHIISYDCDNCEFPLILDSENINNSINPPIYYHVCKKCGSNQILTKEYPIYDFDGVLNPNFALISTDHIASL